MHKRAALCIVKYTPNMAARIYRFYTFHYQLPRYSGICGQV